MDLIKLTDNELVLEAQQNGGKDRIMNIIYERNRSRIMNLILRMVHNRDDAEDLLQESFIKAYRNLHYFDTTISMVRTWLYKIATNHTLDHLKKQKRMKYSSLEEGMYGEDFSPLDLIILHESRGEVRQEISALPQEIRKALEMRQDGYSYAQIAEISDTPVGTVKSRIYRGINKLKQRVGTQEKN